MKHKSVSSRSREAVAGSSELKKNPLARKVATHPVVQKNGLFLVIGAGTALDISGSHLKYPSLGSLADDAKVLQRDFWAVGDDLKTVLQNQLSHLKR